MEYFTGQGLTGGVVALTGLFCPTAACASTGRTVPLRATARPFARGALRPSEHNPIKRQAEPAAGESRASMDSHALIQGKLFLAMEANPGEKAPL